MEKYTMFMDQKNQHSENEYATQSNLNRFDVIAIKLPTVFFRELEQIICMEIQKTICMEVQNTSNSQSNPEKEKWNWRDQPA